MDIGHFRLEVLARRHPRGDVWPEERNAEEGRAADRNLGVSSTLELFKAKECMKAPKESVLLKESAPHLSLRNYTWREVRAVPGKERRAVARERGRKPQRVAAWVSGREVAVLHVVRRGQGLQGSHWGQVWCVE